MRVLWITTKPPLPAIDGGRLLVKNTLGALAALGGVEVDLVAPYDPRREDPRDAAGRLREICQPHLVPLRFSHPATTLLRAWIRDRAYSLERHGHNAVRERIRSLLASSRFDVIHVEQLQALGALPLGSGRPPTLPIVLRSQNVESELWSELGRVQRWARAVAEREALQLRRIEAGLSTSVARVLAVSLRDARRLVQLGGPSLRVEHLPAPFPSQLPAANGELAGTPAVVCLGSSDWLPNRDGTGWFLREVWPLVRRAEPAAILHLFDQRAAASVASGVEGVVKHAEFAGSRDAFARNAILAVPLRIASGVRMKILESWARGVPVVATPEAVAGFERSREPTAEQLDRAEGVDEATAITKGEQAATEERTERRDATAPPVIVARSARSFATEIVRMHRNPSARAELVRAGHEWLAREHDPARIAGALARAYGEVASERSAR